MEVGAAGSARTVCYLTNNPANPAMYILIGVDVSNRPLVQVTDNVPALVADVTPSYPVIAAGKVVAVRFAWDSLNLIGGVRMASLTVNGEAIPAGDWIADPLVAWDYFEPSHLVLGLGLVPALDFNGNILSVQVSNVVTP
jgi:hypothetical protein